MKTQVEHGTLKHWYPTTTLDGITTQNATH